MITAAHVQAMVVDITNASAPIPPQLVIDANVLYWIFYPNFTSLASVGGRSPVPYQTRHYPKFWRNASKRGTKFLAELTNMGEFVKLAEHAEWEAIWCTDAPSSRPNLVTPVTQFDPRICKLCRYDYTGQLTMVRQAVETMVASARKAVGLLPQFASADDQQTATLQEWIRWRPGQPATRGRLRRS